MLFSVNYEMKQLLKKQKITEKQYRIKLVNYISCVCVRFSVDELEKIINNTTYIEISTRFLIKV